MTFWATVRAAYNVVEREQRGAAPSRPVDAALDATAGFRGVEIAPLSSVVDDLVELRERTYRAYRTALGVDGTELPADFGEVVDAVTTFADPLAGPTGDLRWHAGERRWMTPT